MKKEDLRKIEFKHSMDGGYSFQTYNGYFHSWGLEGMNYVGEDGQDKGISYTVAIVEDEDGKVSTVNPEYIKFKTH